MTSKQLNQKLIELLPDIKDLYNEEVCWQEGDDTGSHVVFGDVLTKFILESEDADIIQKCFDVIENILDLNDTYADEVITLSVLERLLYEDTNFEKFMKSKTKKNFLNL